MSERAETVLVTGGTGNIGSAFVERLAASLARPRLRVATRKVDAPAARLARAMSPDTVQPVVFDLARPETLDAAFDGVTRLFVIAPFIEDMAGWHATVGAAAKRAGTVEHIVKVSVTGARAPTSDPPPGRIPLSHWQGEEALRATGIAATMVRPTIFMQHFLSFPSVYTAGADRFYLPTGAAKVAFLDCRDIATVAAALLLGDAELRRRYTGVAFELTGPEGLTAGEIASTLGWAAGRTITHVDGEEAFVENARRQGGGGEAMKFVYAEAGGGWFGKVETGAFEAITGRRPTSFAAFALDHAAWFEAR
jgi:uncharacterized protein YbjT (DUF2867 family)